MRTLPLLLVAGAVLTSCGQARPVALAPADSPSAPATSPPTNVAPGPSGNATATAGGAPVATAGTASSGPAVTQPPGGGPGASSPPAPRPTTVAHGGTLTVTEADSGRRVVLRPGDRLRVRLGTDGSTWDPPQSSSATLRPTSSDGGYPTGRPVDATFLSTGTGAADVTAAGDAACFHTTPRCLMASRQWRVHVEVR